MADEPEPPEVVPPEPGPPSELPPVEYYTPGPAVVEPVPLTAQPMVAVPPEEAVTLSMEFSVFTPTADVAAQAVNLYLLAGGGQERPAMPEGPALRAVEPEQQMPAVEVTASQPESPLGPITYVGVPGIRTEEEAPPRSPPPEPFPPEQPEGP